MQHREFAPPTEIAGIIKCFWYDQKDFGDSPTGFEVLPDGYAEIIFHFGSVFSLSRGGSLLPLPSPFLTGLLRRPFLFYAKNRLEIIGVRCHPWTVFGLLGLPSARDEVQAIEHPVARLQPALKKLVTAGRIDEAIGRAASYFLQTSSAVAGDGVLAKAGAAMREAKGALPVSAVAAAAQASVRTLERKFKRNSGHTVKGVSALIRFEQVRNRLRLDPDSNIADLAYELDFTDQPHLIREFKRYSGTTPAAFARKAKSEQKVTTSDFVAFIQ